MRLPPHRLSGLFAGHLLLLLLPAIVRSDTAFHGSHLNVKMDHIANNDVLAWSLLGVLGLTLGMVSACGWGIYRQFRKPSPESELIQEIMESQKRISPDAGPVPGIQNIPPKAKDWERPAGWWKSPPQD